MNWQLLARLAIVGAVFYLGWVMRTVTVPLLAAYMLMLICLPWRQRMEGKIGGLGATLVCMLVLLVGPLLLLPPIALEIDGLVALLPSTADQAAATRWSKENVVEPLRDLLSALPENWAERTRSITESDTLTQIGPQIAGLMKNLGANFVGFLGGMFGIISVLLLLPIFLFYLLQGAPWFPRLREQLPKSWKPSFDRTIPQIQDLLRTYVRARLLVAVAKGALTSIILFSFQIPGAYTLGLLVGALSLVPVIGALISSVAILVIAMRVWGPMGLLIAVGVYAVVEFVEGYVLMPRLVGRELGMSDFAVILALLGGGTVMGVFGLLIAVPLVAVARVLYDEYLRPVMQDVDERESRPSAGDGDAASVD